jgi:hypothetical protein
MFLRARPEEAAEIAIKRLQLRNISRSMTLGSRDHSCALPKFARERPHYLYGVWVRQRRNRTLL